MSAISDKYTALGGAAFLGTPVGPEEAAANGGRKQRYTGGAIFWSPATGAFEVHGEILGRYDALGSEAGPLGYPLTDESSTRDGAGRFNDFQLGSIVWRPDLGAHDVRGPLQVRWRELGDVQGLGYPLNDQGTTPDGGGTFNHFNHGSIYWTKATGAHEIRGAIRQRWAALGWERGYLGYPVAPPTEEVRNRVTYQVATFQHGSMEHNTQTGFVWVNKQPSPGAPNFEVPVMAFRVSDDDGSRPCSITADGVRQWVDEANLIFAAAGVRFTYDGALPDMKDTQVNSMVDDADPHWADIVKRLDAIAARNRKVVVVFRFGPGPGQIGGGFSWITYDFVAMSIFDPNALSVLPHELGHHFGLPHTFGRIFATVQDASDYIVGGGSVEALDGDRGMIDDTPADPYIEELHAQTSVLAVQLAGQPFALQRRNLMSYYAHGRTADLSKAQLERVRTLVLQRRDRYLDVTVISGVDCAQLQARIDAVKAQIALLTEELAGETDPRKRGPLLRALQRLRQQLGVLTAQAQANGCAVA